MPQSTLASLALQIRRLDLRVEVSADRHVIRLTRRNDEVAKRVNLRGEGACGERLQLHRVRLHLREVTERGSKRDRHGCGCALLRRKLRERIDSRDPRHDSPPSPYPTRRALRGRHRSDVRLSLHRHLAATALPLPFRAGDDDEPLAPVLYHTERSLVELLRRRHPLTTRRHLAIDLLHARLRFVVNSSFRTDHTRIAAKRRMMRPGHGDFSSGITSSDPSS